jgi:hypothetical protein
MNDLLSLVPAALDIIKALTAGDAEKAAQKTKALGQAIALKQTTRAAAKAATALKK